MTRKRDTWRRNGSSIARVRNCKKTEEGSPTIPRGFTAHHGDFGPSRVRSDPFELTTIPALEPHLGRCKRRDFVEPNYCYCSLCQLPTHQFASTLILSVAIGLLRRQKTSTCNVRGL